VVNLTHKLAVGVTCWQPNISVANTEKMLADMFCVGRNFCWLGVLASEASLCQGNQEPLVVRDKVGRYLCQLVVIMSMECDILPSVR